MNFVVGYYIVGIVYSYESVSHGADIYLLGILTFVCPFVCSVRALKGVVNDYCNYLSVGC